jgi:hypothetical protein
MNVQVIVLHVVLTFTSRIDVAEKPASIALKKPFL